MTEIIDPPFDCPYCGCRIEMLGEIAGIEGLRLDQRYPHSTCPECHKCMGCYNDLQDPSKSKETVSAS